MSTDLNFMQSLFEINAELFKSFTPTATDFGTTNFYVYTTTGYLQRVSPVVYQMNELFATQEIAPYHQHRAYSRYASGDDIDRCPPMGPYPVVMFICSVGMAYPVTGVDYSPAGKGSSDFFGTPLKPGFDCPVACVNEAIRILSR
jgi:hypothetical protein